MTDLAYLRHAAETTGVFLRREAVHIGCDDDTLARLVKVGLVKKVRHGAYTFPELWPESAVRRHQIAAKAVMRTHRDRVALSHTTSALFREVDAWGLDLSKVHVTRVDRGPSRSSRDVSYHQGKLEPADITVVDGLAMTSFPRAVLETVLLHPVEQGVVVVSSALNKQLVDRHELEATYRRMAGWPGTQHADLVMRLADGRSESVGESRALYLMWSHGVPMPQLQYEVRDASGALIGTTDFAWPEHGVLGEFDGKEKYTRHLREGETPGDVVFREKKREDLLRRATGWRIIRLTWADLHHPARTAALIRNMLGLAA